ncbi:type VI secretion system-associated protein TagO [Rhodobacter sp. TJ_12]|uniref:type VI secretion system-associated protein TagO n=1 Tax=Rhodobacter sp. TJ_12 TaxID=2029399 RepID=UPI001CBF99F4|nr:type VI secretion system-associated protein TagO [Rhodobacter sp. TJ_12]
MGIEADLDRLACYDLESGRTPQTTAEETQSAWTVRVETSDFTDTTSVYMQTVSQEDVNCGRLRTSAPATLFIRCHEDTTSIFIATNCHLASGFSGYGSVDLRIDDLPATKVRMDASTNNSALGLWSGARAIPMIKKMLGHKTMLVRFTPFNESATTASFDIRGIDDAIPKVREACHW